MVVKDITEAGKNKLKPGKTGVLAFKVKVREGDPLYGLDLRGAQAQILKEGELPLTPAATAGADAADTTADELMDDSNFPEDTEGTLD